MLWRWYCLLHFAPKFTLYLAQLQPVPQIQLLSKGSCIKSDPDKTFLTFIGRTPIVLNNDHIKTLQLQFCHYEPHAPHYALVFCTMLTAHRSGSWGVKQHAKFHGREVHTPSLSFFFLVFSLSGHMLSPASQKSCAWNTKAHFRNTQILCKGLQISNENHKTCW